MNDIIKCQQTRKLITISNWPLKILVDRMPKQFNYILFKDKMIKSQDMSMDTFSWIWVLDPKNDEEILAIIIHSVFLMKALFKITTLEEMVIIIEKIEPLNRLCIFPEYNDNCFL